MSYLQTISGRRFYFDQLREDSICITDIAHALSMVNRFGGHTVQPYSVAQHCVEVAKLLPQNFKLHGLLHDAHEAYVGDNIRPFKRCFPLISDLEARIDLILFKKFGVEVNPFSVEHVKWADNLMLSTEAVSLMPGGCDWIKDWGLPAPLSWRVMAKPWDEAKEDFLRMFEELTA